MKHILLWLIILASALLAAAMPAGGEVIPVATPAAVSLLPDSLGAVRASGSVATSNVESEVEVSILKEYRVSTIAVRQYGRVVVRVYETASHFAAYGLFTYESRGNGSKPTSVRGSSGSAWNGTELLLWKGRFFARVSGVSKGSNPAGTVASSLAGLIGSTDAENQRPKLLSSLPRESLIEGSERYVLGPESLGTFVPAGGRLLEFWGQAEAVVGEYTQRGSEAASSNLTLFIVEYHTPQFAYDAWERLDQALQAMGGDERDTLLVRRVGNFIVGAAGVSDRVHAERLIDSIEYPYVVKWLRDPLLPTSDPFHWSKTGDMLLSTMLLIALGLLIMLGGGSLFGTIIFMRRRKHIRELFSDAGGMLRLGVDPSERRILGLPPKSGDES